MSQVNLEVTPQTLQELSVCLQATLSNEKQERRKGKDAIVYIIYFCRRCSGPNLTHGQDKIILS